VEAKHSSDAPAWRMLYIDQGPLWDILTKWLFIEDVCHLDSALCQKWRNRRADFLALLATKVLLFNREPIVVLTVPYVDSHTHRALGAAALNWILKRGIHLASLHLPSSSYMSADEQESIRESVASLALHGRLDKLETISLVGCRCIKDAEVTAILSKCFRSVKSIDIRECGLAESSATYIKHCTGLEAFAAHGNESSAEVVEIVQACPKLRKVNIQRIGSRLTDEVLQSVAAHCRLLEHLSLQECSAVSDAAIRRVAESCPLLQYVNLDGTSITDASVVSLCTHCPLLKRQFSFWM
jgi:hypothetical protein